MIAVGLGDGQIILHNLRFDETVVKFSQDWGPVTVLAFRTGVLTLNLIYLIMVGCGGGGEEGGGQAGGLVQCLKN